MMRMKRMMLRVKLLVVQGRLVVAAESVSTRLVPRATAASASPSGDASADAGDAEAPPAATRKVAGASFTFTPSWATCGIQKRYKFQPAFQRTVTLPLNESRDSDFGTFYIEIILSQGNPGLPTWKKNTALVMGMDFVFSTSKMRKNVLSSIF